MSCTRIQHPISIRRRSRWIPLARHLFCPILATIACLLCLPMVRATEEIVVVRSSGAGPYQEAAEIVRSRLVQAQREVEVVNLSDLTDNADSGYKKRIADAKVRLFVAIGTQAATWLHQQAPESIGLVYCMVSDPEAAGLTKGRVTRGISTTVSVNKQLALILETLPKVRKIGMLYSNKDKVSQACMTELKGLLPVDHSLVAVAVEDHANTTDAVQQLIDAKPDIVWTSPDANVYNAATVRALLLNALRAKLPVFGFSSGFVRAGALFGLGVEPAKQGEQCGELAVEFFTADKNNSLADYLKAARVLAPRFQLAVNKIVDKQLDSPLAESVVTKAEIVFK